MRVRLDFKGVNTATRRRPSGKIERRYYLGRGKGAVRLQGEPGTPEFLATYQAALADRKQAARETIKALIEDYKRSTAFTHLADRTKYDYLRQLAKIEREFGDAPLAALEDRRITRDFLEWRDLLAQTSARQGDYAWTVLMRILSFGRQRGLTSYRPPERVERLYQADRA